MRKFAVVGLAVLGSLLVVAGLAYAAQVNTYSSTASVSPSKSGTAARPTPISTKLTFTVGEATGQRPSPIRTYAIGLGPGIVPNTNVLKGCTSAQANAGILPAACAKRASSGGPNVGGGSVNAVFGPSNDPSVKASCFLTVTLLNSTKKNHLWIRVVGSTTAPPPKNCPAPPPPSSIDASYVKGRSVARKGGGTVPVWSLKFTVPSSLAHPVGGLDVAVVNNVSNIGKFSKRIGRVLHGYLESVGCPKSPSGKRSAVTTFTSEAGQTSTSTTTSKCT